MRQPAASDGLEGLEIGEGVLRFGEKRRGALQTSAGRASKEGVEVDEMEGL